MNNFIIIEIRKPRTPMIKIPAADTFAILRNSSFVGFFKTSQTRLHLAIKGFIDPTIFMN